jgi:hypothetical protein
MMKKILRYWIFTLVFLFSVNMVYAEKNVNSKSSKHSKGTKIAGCDESTGYQFLQLNNVRARVNTGGDMWWDMDGLAQYFIPAEGRKTSMFAASLWIGGLDINNQLKIAANTYRQDNSGDFYPGPLTIDGTAAISKDVCGIWDKMFVINKADVKEFVGWWESENRDEEYPGYTIPLSILDYPAHGNEALGQSKYLAPFFDRDGDGLYNPSESGDYPYYDFDNSLCPLNFAGDINYKPAETMESEYYDSYYGGILVDQVLKGDETIWWVFNDKGNTHGETEGDPIGLEFHAQAFAFTTNDAINDMTFYSYEIINRSTYVLTNTIFAPWADTDLGNATDDFVGCDITRGLGYCYNGDENDNGGPEAYGLNPPAVGVDFFQGPYLDPDQCDNPGFRTNGLLGPSIDDGQIVSLDGATNVTLHYGDSNQYVGQFNIQAEAINGVNFGNGIVDDERYGMKSFIFFNNDFSPQGNPNTAVEFYNYLRGLWKKGDVMYYGGDAYATGVTDVVCRFMFPDDSDPYNWGTNGIPPGGGYGTEKFWNEIEEDNNPADRRLLQTAGPFTLKPGAVNYITVGIPWARTKSGDPWESVELLKIADDKCQALFDNCFTILDGPAAPDLSFTELDKKFIIHLSNSKGSNNYNESFSQLDPTIPKNILVGDSTVPLAESERRYYFEGYQIFQLKNQNVTLAQSIYDNNSVRLVAQYDKKNGVGRIINYKFDAELNATVPVLEVDGNDNGIEHSFEVVRDLFPTSGDDRLVNYKKYYYAVIAYAYNNYKTYNQEDPSSLTDGQRMPYLPGRQNVKLYTAIPHKPGNGIIMNSDFGDGPEITRIEGSGNGGMKLELTDASVEALLAKSPLDTNFVFGVDTFNVYNDNAPILFKPTYKGGNGPIEVKVIDPLAVKKGHYRLSFDTTFTWFTNFNVSGEMVEAGGDTAGYTTTWWKMEDMDSDKVYYSDTSINYPFEQMFPELGISIKIQSIYQPGLYQVGGLGKGKVFSVLAKNNGFISATMEYADSSKIWLGGLADVDGLLPIDWIKCGTSADDYQIQGGGYLDPNQDYEKMFGGTWAPFCMAGQAKDPATQIYPTPKKFDNQNLLKELASVDIVLTSDKSKWTRCPVVEECYDNVLSEGGAKQFTMRKHKSVDKDGKSNNDTIASNDPDDPNYISPYGYGWFPGYAINLETGERLNIMFGEDSHLLKDNGNDMKFNPTSNIIKELPDASPLIGGKHYVYIMKTGYIDRPITGTSYWPPYDAGRHIGSVLASVSNPNQYMLTGLYESVMYVGMPMAIKDKEDEWLSNDVTLKIRIAKPYQRFISNTHDILANPGNMEYPAYEFSLDNLVPEFGEEAFTKDIENINITPNPYYAHSEYETNALSNVVKIINLPKKCFVGIYNTSGTLIRKFSKDDDVSFIEWDLKNSAGIPIAGGMYVIYVKETETGKEHILKWFGSLRIEDFNQF